MDRHNHGAVNLHNPFERGSPFLASLVSSIVMSVVVNCNDALLLEKVLPVAKEQRLAVARR